MHHSARATFEQPPRGCRGTAGRNRPTSRQVGNARPAVTDGCSARRGRLGRSSPHAARALPDADRECLDVVCWQVHDASAAPVVDHKPGQVHPACTQRPAGRQLGRPRSSAKGYRPGDQHASAVSWLSPPPPHTPQTARTTWALPCAHLRQSSPPPLAPRVPKTAGSPATPRLPPPPHQTPRAPTCVQTAPPHTARWRRWPECPAPCWPG